MSDKQLAAYMIEYVGGKNNIKNVVHCITRVRFYLVDKERADTTKIKELNGVMGVVEAQGQYQVVVGNKVNAIYEEVMRQLNNDQVFDSKEGVLENDSNSDFLQLFRNGFNQFIGIITGSMMPVIGLLAGAGIIKGLQASLVTFGLLQDSSQSYLLINTIADGIFIFTCHLRFYCSSKIKGESYYSGSRGCDTHSSKYSHYCFKYSCEGRYFWHRIPHYELYSFGFPYSGRCLVSNVC